MEKKRLIQSSNNLHSEGILNTKLHHQHPLQYLNMLFTHQSSIETLLSILLVSQLVNNPTAMQESLVWSLGWEGPLEGDRATYYSILAWGIHEQSMGSQRVRHNWAIKFSTTLGMQQNMRHFRNSMQKGQDTCSGSGKLFCLLTYHDWDFHTLGKNNQVNNNVFTQHYLAKSLQWSFLRTKRKVSQHGIFYCMFPWVSQVGKNKQVISNMSWSLAPLPFQIPFQLPFWVRTLLLLHRQLPSHCYPIWWREKALVP